VFDKAIWSWLQTWPFARLSLKKGFKKAITGSLSFSLETRLTISKLKLHIELNLPLYLEWVKYFHKNSHKFPQNVLRNERLIRYQSLSINILSHQILKIFYILLRPFWCQSNIRKYGAQRESHAKHSPIKKHKALSGQLLIYSASIARRIYLPIRVWAQGRDRQAGLQGRRKTGKWHLTLFANKNKGVNLISNSAIAVG